MEEARKHLDITLKEANYNLISDEVVAASKVLDVFIVQAQRELNARNRN